MTVLGGLGVLAGPLIGVAYFIGVPAFVPLDSAGLAGTRLFALILILYLPGGMAQGLQPVRDRLFAWLAARFPATDDLFEAENTRPGQEVLRARHRAPRLA